MGSGTIIGQNSDELLILTSYHVVEDCSSLYVTFINDANVDGYIKAADPDKDIAVVAIPLADIDEDTMNSIKVATICTEEPKVGEGCLVIGNALGYGISVTSGIVSKTDRELYVDGKTLDVIQTDAAINFGNSGGCMVNSKGEIIGIAEAKTVVSSVEGMCYAIPVARNMDLIQSLMNAEEPFDPQQENVNVNGGFLGIRGRDVTADLSQEFEMPEGIYVSSIVPGSGAESAGILSGDIIVGFEGEPISTMAELQYRIGNLDAGDTVNITINRLVDGTYETMDIEVTLTDRIS
jgi:serine protease Do